MPADQLKRVKRATDRRSDAERAWVASILDASEHHTLREIAKAAGVTNPRIHQIIKRHRGAA